MLACVMAAALPQRFKRYIYRRWFGWQVAEDAFVGLSIIAASTVTLGPKSHIGHFNWVQSGVEEFHLGADSWIHNFNQFNGPGVSVAFPVPTFRMGNDSHIMSHHFFDCAGRVDIGTGCVVAGRGSQFWTHSVFTANQQRTMRPRDLRIGDRAYIGAGVIVVHCAVPIGVTVGAGAVLTRSLLDVSEESVIAGNPARVVREGVSETPGGPLPEL
jgi:acetyltransferase-like isoleucine patch superfamily enzyme